MKLRIKFIIILYIFSTFMIIGSKSPLKNSHIIESQISTRVFNSLWYTLDQVKDILNGKDCNKEGVHCLL